MREPTTTSAAAAAQPRQPSKGQHAFGWSFGVGHLFGIELRIHATFFLLLAWIALGHVLAGHGWRSALLGAVTLLGVFAIVVVHELSHALVARRFGIPTRDITLLPIGGVASLERMPQKPGQELLVAFAGPAVNIALALVALAVLLVFDLPLRLAHASDPAGDNLVTQLFWVNLGLAGFNLLPAFPMDGGRVLRALLSMRMDRTRATVAAARVGRVIAVAFGIAGLVANPILILIAFFVWVGAGAEADMELTRSVFHRHVVGDVTVGSGRLATLAPDDTMARAIELSLHGFQSDFPVVDAGGKIAGVLTRSGLLRALAEDKHTARLVRDAMNPEVVLFAPAAPLDDIVEPLQKGEPVLVGDAEHGLQGMVTADNLRELTLVDAATARARAS